jgi:Asp-tRNA(Asn)/Glu-tRNA(Gln) amidotransferase A subunit family amidase
MPGQAVRAGSAADDLVGQERMDIEDRLDLGCGYVRPAEAERGHPAAQPWQALNALLLLLRNTSVINFLDRCAITVPIRMVGPPLGLMIVEHGGDRDLLGVGRGIEAALNRTL